MNDEHMTPCGPSASVEGALPILDVVHDDLGARFGGVLPADTFDEVAVRVYIFLSPEYLGVVSTCTS